MDDDGRFILLETETARVRSDIQELRVSVDGVKAGLSTFREDVAKEFGSVRTEMAEGFGAVRAEMGAYRAEVVEKLGAVRTEVATQFGAMGKSMERNTRWLIVTGLGSVATLITMFATVARALKWF